MKDEAQFPTPTNATLTLGTIFAPCFAFLFVFAYKKLRRINLGKREMNVIDCENMKWVFSYFEF
jgi:hypothetical protein